MTYSAVLSNNEEDHIHVLEIDMKEKMRSCCLMERAAYMLEDI